MIFNKFFKTIISYKM